MAHFADPRYPIGEFVQPATIDRRAREGFIQDIEAAPVNLRGSVAGLQDVQLDTHYRAGGWTVRQVVHHLPDSHLNAYVRFKLALTEEKPTIKTYDEARWAEMADSKTTPPEVSVKLLESLHRRWVKVLESMSAQDFARQMNHPEHGLMTLDKLLALYAWHGPHHVAHIMALRERKSWK